MSTTIKNQFNIISKNTTFPINNDKITKYFYLFPKQNDELFGKNIMSNFIAQNIYLKN